MSPESSTTVGERSVRLGPAVDRDWALWVDWCTATDHDPHHTAGTTLAAFLRELPATTAVQERRVRNIHRAHTGRGEGLPRPTTTVRPRVGRPWLSYPDALTALRHEWCPDGVAARRDALILTLTAHGFTRTRIRRLQPALVETFPAFTVDGHALARHYDPALCARCALTRWLAVLDAYRHRSGRDIEELLMESRVWAHPRHDCGDLLDDGWRTIPWLIPAIDRHGAIASGQPVTGRALTGILTRRFTPGPIATQIPTVGEAPPREPGRRPTHDEQDDLARLYDRIDEQADALNARIEALLAGLETETDAPIPCQAPLGGAVQAAASQAR